MLYPLIDPARVGIGAQRCLHVVLGDRFHWILMKLESPICPSQRLFTSY